MSSPIYCSPTFKFIVDGKDFYVHEILITQHSKPLERMIHGAMAEAQQGFATIKEVDHGTFSRFVDWLYKGYYHAAEPAEDMTRIPEAKVQPEKAEQYDGWGYPKNKKKQRDSYCAQCGYEHMDSPDDIERTTRSAKQQFVQRIYNMRNISNDHPQPRPNKALSEDYTEVFLCHARLYVFAEQYDIQGLKILAMEDLHAVLAVYTLHKECTGDIMSLLQYIYAETLEAKEGVDDLRTLMTQYIEIEVGTLIKDEGLGDLMIEDGGCMLADFLKVMRKRLVSDSLLYQSRSEDLIVERDH